MGYKQYCKDYEKIENYEKALADNFVGWECHHRLETHTPDGERRAVDITAAELIALGMYYNRPAEELIFLTRSEHHEYRKGKKSSTETRRKISEAKKGKPKSEEARKKMSEAKKGHLVSEEARKKISEGNKGHLVSEETRKKMSEAKKGHLVSEEARKKMSEAKKGHLVSEEARKKMSEAKKGNKNALGTRWYNNGKINTMSKECPEGFVPGMLK